MRAGLYRLSLVLGDMAIFYIALGLALFIRRPLSFSENYYLFHIGFFTMILPVYIGINVILGLYDFRQLRDLPAIIGESILAFAYSLGISFGVFYLMGNASISPKTHLFLALFLATLFGVLWRRGWMTMGSSSLFATKTLFLGDNPLMNSIVADLRDRKYPQFRLLPPETFERWREKALKRPSGDGGKEEKLSEIIDLVVIDSEAALADQKSQAVVSAAMDHGVPIWTHIDFYEEIYKKVPLFIVNNPAWLLAHVLHRRKGLYVLFKQITDTCAAGLLILLLLPFLPLIALVIKLNDGGPVFYSQVRAGHLKENFNMWKFRTMRPDADKLGYLWNTAGADPRITAVGRFLRKFRLDELPQLWNVVRGEMSLVGPRPTWVGEKQVQDIPEYYMRRFMKPGITGWAQINSSATDSKDDTLEKLGYDFYYIKNISFALDISILLKTVRRVLQSDQTIRHKRRL